MPSLRFVFALAAVFIGCAKVDTETQITVAVVAETTVPDELSQLEIVVTGADGSEVFRAPYTVTSPRFFPSTLAVVPKNEKSFAGPITIDVRSTGVGVIERRARLNFVRGRSLLLPIPLRMSCLGFPECAADESCVGGVCQSATVDGNGLADYAESLVFASDASASSPCFDEAACLADEKVAAIAADCTFPFPMEVATGAVPRFNVAVQWRDAEHRLIALPSNDEREGWVVLGANVGRLSPGVCTSLLEPGRTAPERAVPERAIAIYTSTACPALVAHQPFCRGADAHVGVGRKFR